MKKPPDLRLSSRATSIAQLSPYIQSILGYRDISRQHYGDILISLTEAVMNAIQHGNQGDHNKWVRVSLLDDHDVDLLVVRVTDEGAGFDPEQVPDPTLPEHILCDHGRGVFLMRALTHQIKYFNNGSTVELHFKIS